MGFFCLFNLGVHQISETTKNLVDGWVGYKGLWVYRSVGKRDSDDCTTYSMPTTWGYCARRATGYVTIVIVIYVISCCV